MTKGKAFVISVVFIAVLALFTSCNQDVKEPEKTKGYGTLAVSIERPRGVTNCNVYVKSSTMTYSNVFQASGELCKVEKLEEGDYVVYAEGLDANGNAILKSHETKVPIGNNLTTSVTLGLDLYVDGTGMLNLTVGVPADNVYVDGILLRLTDTSDTTFEYALGNPSTFMDGLCLMYSTELQLNAGKYVLSVGAFHVNGDGSREQLGANHVEQLEVFKNHSYSFSLSLDDGFSQAVENPTIHPAGGLCKEGTLVRIETSNPRASIYYSTDGTEPSISSNRYVNPIIIDKCMTIKTIAVIEGLGSSAVVEEAYRVKVEDPILSIKDKSIVDYDALSITTTTSDATIIYTLDGTEPSLSNGTVYDGPISIERTLTVKTRAFKDGLEPSNVVSAQYYDGNTPSADRYFSIDANGAISVNKDLKERLPSVVIIPSRLNGIDVVEIATNGFANHWEIENIAIPASVRKISARAFKGCTGIESIELSEYITYIDKDAFSGWTSNQRINDESGLINKAYSLGDCNARIYTTVRNDTQVVSGYTGMKNLYGIKLTGDITAIAANAFSGCVNLEEFELPSYVTSIGSLAFNDCTKIESITLPKTLSTLALDAFTGWTNEQSIIDNSCIAFSERFVGSDAKVYTRMPPKKTNNEPVTEIPSNMCAGRSDLYGLWLPDTIETIGDYAFEGTNIEEIEIPSSVKSLGLEVFRGWNDSQKVSLVYNGYEASVSDDGLQTPFTDSDAMFEVSIAKGVTEIKDDAFNGMASLGKIEIPSSVKKLGDRAFARTSLRSVSIGANVISVGDESFIGCGLLEEVSFGSKLGSIGEKAFFGCDSIVEVKLPDSVYYIGDMAFAYCSRLEKVDLGTRVSNIPSKAFFCSDSLSSLTAPSCMGSMAVTVKVPLNQLIVHDIDLLVYPTYASIEGFSTSFARSEQEIDGDFRVFYYEIPSMLGLDYTVDVELKDFNGGKVGSRSKAVAVANEKQNLVLVDFFLGDLSNRTLSNIVITPSSGIILDGETVEIENEDADAIYYTLDGSDPSPEKGIGTLYTEPIVLHSLETIKAIAIKEGYAHSAVARTTFSNMKTLPPILLLDSSVTYPSTQHVEIKPVTEGSSIIYTLDGTDPSDAGLEYTGPIEIGETTTLRAVAWKKGFLPSDEVSAEYVISIPSHEVETPTVHSLSIERNVEDGNVSFEAILSPSSDNATYEWYLDGEKVCTDKVYAFSNDTELGWHIIEAKAKVDGRSYSSELMYEHKGWYRMEFYEKWAKDPSYYNPDPALYDGVYMSNLFGEYEGSDSKGMRIIVKGYGRFSLYVRCGSSSEKENVSVSIDSGSSIKTVKGGSGSSKDIDGYTLVEVPVPDDGKAHTIFVTFERFNTGTGEGDEFRGFVLIPKAQ